MAELAIGSQSSLLLPKFGPHINTVKAPRCLISIRGPTISSHHKALSISRVNSPFPAFSCQAHQKCHFQKRITAVSDSTVPNLDDTSGGGGSGDDSNGGNGGGGGNGGNEEPDESESKRGKALSMSQKLTLAYAALVGFGGLMGFLKSGSQKSLAAGGVSAMILYYVYTQLPTKPVFASSIGLGMSAALLVVMGSRFKKSGKVFPVGVVSLVSLIMTGGYLHGVFRAAH